MNANSPLIGLARICAGTVLSCSLVLSAYGAQTALSNEPFSSSSAVTAKPNIMFVLDDSGSMKQDYLPDWAGPYQQLVSGVMTVITPAHRFFNNAFNGVAYNPATRYRPPVMYTSAGALDTTTYPSMTGTTTGTGGDASATSALPNWRAVKVDGYGVQSTATVNLEGQAFSYTTVAGEYCDSKQLRTCTDSASATGSYTQPATLRWCTTDALANETTANAGTNCLANNIANTATNIAAGVTPYIYARMPKPRTSTITVNAAGTVTAITVDTKQILNASATGGGSVDLATDIAAKINACTYLIPASSDCTVVGFSATTNGANVVVVTAPTITTSTPAISGGSTNVTAFTGGSVPGGSLFTVITPSVNSYPFPGTATKGVNRIDCAGTTCTYAEEMANYANWYAYYRTRMQMMKTSSSVAFANVDDNFRVGYYTINNGSGSDFINLNAFDGGQKYQWYSKFFRAVPYGVTPLRTGLANAGKIYAGKISSLNSVAVTDPLQYSCQQNYTILSTDGYWNDSNNPTKLDGSEIGEQDGNDPRPYYDGATQTRTVSQTTQYDEQWGINQILVQSRTRQQQTSTTPLNQSTYNLESRSYSLKSETQQLLEKTFNLESTPQILQSNTFLLTKVTTPLQQNVFNITRTTSPLQSTTTLVNSTPYALQSTTTLVNSTTAPLQMSTALLNSTTSPLQSTTTLVNSTPYALLSTTTKVNSTPYALQSTTTLVNSTTSPLQSTTTLVNSTPYALLSTTTKVNSTTSLLQSTTTLVNSTTSPLQSTTTLVNSTTYALLKSTYKLQTNTRQLQKSSEVSTDGGDTWQSTGWVDASSCTTLASGPGYTRNTTCRYNTAVVVGGLNSCTTVPMSSGPTYTVAQAVTCSYETLPIVTPVATCSVVSQPNYVTDHYEPSVGCGYSAVNSVVTGQDTCTAKDQTGAATMTGDKVVCGWDSPSTAVGVGSCTATVSPTTAAKKITCAYGPAGTTLTGQDTCTAKDQTGAATMSGDKVVCGWDAASPTVTLGPADTCNATLSPTTAAKKIVCTYGAAGSTVHGLDTCAANDQTGAATMTGHKVVCGWDSPSTAVDVGPAGTCTATVSPTTAAKKIACTYSTVAGTKSTGLDTCTAKDETGVATMTGYKVLCGWDSPSTAVGVGSCTATVSPTTAAKKITCAYGTPGTKLTGQDTCTANDQTGAAAMTGDKVVCGWDSPSTAVDVGPAGTCTATVSPTTAAKKITCAYSTAAGTKSTGLDACTAKNQTGAATMTGDKVVCDWDSPSTAVDVGSAGTCTATVSPTTAAKKITCAYSTTAGAKSTGLDTCTAKDQTGAATMTGYKVVCGWDSASAAVGVGTCTATVSPTTAAKKITCAYGTPGTTVHGLSACTAKDQTGAATMTGDKVVCAYDPASTPVPVGTCTPAAATGSATAVICNYGTPGTTVHGLNTCTAKDQTGAATMTGDQVVCGWDSPSAAVAVGTCTATVSPTTAAKKITCAYTTTAGTKSTGLDTCTAKDQTGAATMTGDKVVCGWDPASPAVAAGACTPTASPTTAAKKITCGYGTAGTPQTGQTSCTANDQPTTGNMTGDKVVCAYDTASTTTDQTLCTATTTNTAALPKTTCTYTGTQTTLVDQTSCNQVAQSASPNYSGPAVSCTYQGAVFATNQTSCTAGTASTGPAYSSYSTCAYAAGTKTTGLSSCIYVAKSGPMTFSGPANDCGYSTTSVDVVKTSCSPVAQSGTYDAPQKTCEYDSAVTTATGLSTCTNVAQSTVAPFVGPNVRCSYDTAISAINLNATTCTANDQAGAATMNGSKVTCGYAAAVLSADVSTCTAVAKSAGPVYSGPAVDCAPSTTVTVDTPTCTPIAADVPPLYRTTVTCPVSDTGLVAVAPSCTPSGTPAGTSPVTPEIFDASGKVITCKTTDVTPYAGDYLSGPVPVASCTPGTVTDSSSKIQTTCTLMFSSGPSPQKTCTTVNPPIGNDFVKTTCTPTIEVTQVMGCDELEAKDPLWQTVRCTPNGDGTQNTLADVAAYYYKTDLRTIALGNCIGAIVSPATTGNALCSATDDMNNVRASATDPNTAQHMTTFTLGLGASGYMKYSDTYGTDTTGDFPTVKGVSPFRPSDGITANPLTGVCSWQPNGLCNWPFPTSDEQTTIDDLWHAGVNGHGAYYSARDPASLSAGISSALNGVAAAGGYAAAPSLSTPNLIMSDNYLFTTSYVSLDWTGELLRWRVDPYSGKVAGVKDWSAQAKLDVKAYTSRVIYTFDASVTTTKLKAFTSANYGTNSYFNMPYISATSTGLTQFLCTSPDICLAAADQDSSHASGSNLVNYLRGDRTNEGADIDNTKYYRQRQHVLGDIVNAQSVYVFQPTRDYSDPGYAAFKTAQATRQAVVYAAANDGMMHAFAAKGNATTEALVDTYASAYAASQADPSNAALLVTANTAAAAVSAAIASDATIGQELWAYIPSMVLPKLYKLADKKYRNMHRYLVDATPTVGDICVSNCSDAGTAVWKTILVGGLGHGGRGFFALDITDPSNPKALWEFTNANLGYSYGNVQITKLSTGTWAVLLSSGYNNVPNDDGSGGDGVGRLFVLNAATGTQITGVSPISTGFGNATTPSGLTNIATFVTNSLTDNTLMAAYGGDLYGNLWRFDVNDSVGPTGTEAQLLAVLKDSAGNTQPITTKPIVTEIRSQKVVYVGTGRFLDSVDISDVGQQSLYAIKDPWTTGGTAATAIYDNPGDDRTATGRNTKGFVRQVDSWISCPATTSTTICSTGDQVMKSTNNAVDFTADNGWFIDLINSAEKANTNPALGLGMLVFTTNAPSLLACDIGGKSYIYFLNYLTGGPIVSAGNSGGVVGYLLSNSFASAPSIVVRATPTGGITTPVILVSVAAASSSGSSSSGSTNTGGLGGGIDLSGSKSLGTPLPPEATTTRRTSWRELIRE